MSRSHHPDDLYFRAGERGPVRRSSCVTGVSAGDLHFPDHHAGPQDGAEEGRNAPLSWGIDNVELLTVGVDVGSSTSHLLFAHLHLQRLAQSLSSRFAVVSRQVLHRSEILLTPYRDDGLIDVEALRRFIEGEYSKASLRPEEIDTGAVILTGAALERANSRAVADLFANQGGKFVCASAGHNLEAILAAHGSGAVALSHELGQTVLHIDVGGGTSKLSLVRDGAVVQTAALQVGGRLVAFDPDDRVVRLEPAAGLAATAIDIDLRLGEKLSSADRTYLASALARSLIEAAGGEARSGLTRALMLTEPFHVAEGDQPAAVTLSGGVAEYFYGREARSFGDIAKELAAAIAQNSGNLPARVIPVGEGIRATVIGASQFTVQLSGNTLHISKPELLPLRNLPVIHARLPACQFDAAMVRHAIQQAFRRLDLREGEQPVALALAWRGEPRYGTLHTLAGGIVGAMSRSLASGLPLVIALQEDVGQALGGVLKEDFHVNADIIAIDGLHLLELDYVDLGELIQPANVVPVVVKSLAFGANGRSEAGNQSW